MTIETNQLWTQKKNAFDIVKWQKIDEERKTSRNVFLWMTNLKGKL